MPVVLVSVFLIGAGFLARSLDDVFGGYRADPVPAVAGYRVEQLANACTIVVAGRDLGLDARDQTIAVMTAMGESSLRNLDYGDWETNGVRNPDGSRTTSMGLFQQQDSWGSREARLDPYTAAVLFYRAMTDRVPDRASLEPTLVAHRTQVNDDADHYARYWDRAVRVVAAVTGSPQPGDSIDGIPQCPAA
ncbi:peptidase M23 [Microbacterium sp. NEAU-LLC]|uniref:Peptidase M23 n=1 Tax=Microbacterium helvum TaxID=2773713 RepID=A0ABR8NMP9_9MICO|nr:peptidase M23 [Microbacterium helvum]